MYLSDRQRAAVVAVALEHGITADAEEIVNNALNALLLGEANEAAQKVAEVVGINLICGGHVWYQEKKKMTAEKARAILSQAKTDGVYEDPIPDDDAQVISEANDLVSQAEIAWAQQTRNPAVEAILKLAAADIPQNGETPPTRESAVEEHGETGRPEEELEEPTEDKEPPPVETEKPPLDEEDLAMMEPWDGYGDDRVGDIKEGIDIFVESETAEEVDRILYHIEVYEKAHKDRVRILNHINRIRGIGEDEEGTEEEEESAGAEEEAPSESPGTDGETERDQGAEAEPEGGPEGDHESDEGPPEGGPGDAPEGDAGAAAEEITDAGPEPEPEAPESSTEDRPQPDEAPSSEQDQGPQDDRRDDEYEQLVARVRGDLEKERSVIPATPPADEIPEVPWDWTKLTHAQLQQLYGAYSVLAYHKNWLLAFEERMAYACKSAADEMHRDLLVAIEKYDDHDHEKKVSHLEAEIESDENVKRWRRRQRKHEIYATATRQERDSYNKLVESLSRVETMRHNEYLRSHGIK